MERTKFIGRVFGKLTVVAPGPRKSYANSRVSQVKVRCNCGTEKLVVTSHISRGCVTSCGCNFRSGKDAAVRRIWNMYISNANTRGLCFELPSEVFESLLNAPCHYCDSPPLQTMRSTDGGLKYNGIDRLNNEIGYIPNNVVACCYICNRAKNKIPVEEFIRWTSRIHKKHGVQA